MNSKRLILIELNEINFDYVKEYIKNNKLPNFKAIIDSGVHERV